jgi:hypothetical protein
MRTTPATRESWTEGVKRGKLYPVTVAAYLPHPKNLPPTRSIVNKMEKKQQQMEIKVELDPKTAEGQYSNLVIISHSDSEFVLDFAKFLPGTPTARVHSRIIMTPKHAKLLLRSLTQNIENYERTFREIPLEEEAGFPQGGGAPIIN